jgi:hypothetical protein
LEVSRQSVGSNQIFCPSLLSCTTKRRIKKQLKQGTGLYIRVDVKTRLVLTCAAN